MNNNANTTMTYRRQLQNITNSTFKNVLKSIKDVSRITVVCLESDEARRNLFIAIAEEGMDTDEYMWLMVESRKLGFNQGWKDKTDPPDGKDGIALRAARKFFVIDSQPLNASTQFIADIKAKMQQPPYNCADCTSIEPGVSQVGELADAMMLYALTLNRSITAGFPKPSGTELVHFSKGTFEGYSGTVIINKNFTRDPVFLVYGLDPSDQPIVLMKIVEQLDNDSIALIQEVQSQSVIWANHGGSPPLNRPKCDFDGSACPASFVQQYLAITLVAVIVPVLIIVAAVFFIIRSRRKEEERLNGLWQIPFIMLMKPNVKDTQRHAFYLLGDDSVVARKHNGRPVLKKADCSMLRKMRTIDHDNICKFLGLSLDGPQVLSVWRYCGRGSLKDVIAKGSLQMDWFFKYSLIRDIIELLDLVVFSFAIVCSEIITKKSAWDLENQDYDLDELVYKIKRGGRSPLRPLLETDDEHNSSLSLLVKDCWSEEVEMRPSCDQVKSLIKSMNHNKSSNLMDHVFNVLEQYASNLEDEVQARMKELTEEKKKSDILLYRMLPKQVAERLKLGQPVEPETFDCVTLFFSDVVSFTTLASRCTPLQVVNLLNDLYTVFDAIIDEHDVYKVETIGDGYLCVSGLPHRNGNEHAKEVAEMSFELLRAIRTFRIPHLPNEKINIRVGLHTGSVVTGVVGMTMPRYCLFGDAVNTASRMESNGKPGRVHISTDTMRFLTEVIGGYKTELRGEVIVKVSPL
ncbi:hypothetical protein Y032_0067g3 [Ancylostoma ceylanicum]|nr:hypothetical protein Y032_0067g3 [Ancylostoma ceylanicum]